MNFVNINFINFINISINILNIRLFLIIFFKCKKEELKFLCVVEYFYEFCGVLKCG